MDETKRVLAEVVRNIKTAAEKQHKEKQRVISLSAFSTFVQVHRDLLEYNQLFLLRRYTVCLFWINKVKDDDTVYILGDVGMYHAREIGNILNNLPGRKILVTGNHDFKNIHSSSYKKTFAKIRL